MSSSRAGLPTTISPDGLIDTTLGTSLSPSAPGIIFGPVRSMKATRLLVVPRSMPTTRSVVPKSISMSGCGLWDVGGGRQGFVDFAHKIQDIFPTVQHAPDLRQHVAT